MSYKSCEGVYHAEPLTETCVEVLHAPPGHFWFSEPNPQGQRYLHMKLPSAREQGAYCAIEVDPRGSSTGVWGWDGNLEKPTVTPSIFHDISDPSSSVAWHGFLKAGRFEGC